MLELSGLDLFDVAEISEWAENTGRLACDYAVISDTSQFAPGMPAITYGLNAPPEGFNSTHGVRHQPGKPSEFEDDEYVVYTTQQQRLEYLVEMTA